MEKLNKFTKVFKKIYYKTFIENFKGKLEYNFPDNFYRWDLIEYLIKKNNYTNYLEIGCDQNQLFSKVIIDNKIGVDPVSGGNIRKTSDEFFKENNGKFDIVFIDGLHTYEQVKKDILNSVNCLNENGIILVHDCMPDSLGKQAVPRYKMQWNGDVWKAIVELRTKEDLKVFTCQIDFGVAVIQRGINSKPLNLKIDNFKDLKFKDYYNKNKEFMNVVSYEEVLKKI